MLRADRLCHLAASFAAPFIRRCNTTAAGTLALATAAATPATRAMAAATDDDGTTLVFSYGSNSTARCGRGSRVRPSHRSPRGRRAGTASSA